MRAMRTQRVCHFKSDESDMLVRAGPRMAEAARLMAKCLTDKADASKANDKPKAQP
jgi:iron complex transport system substrate-binding protein